jgi:ankyrin repeat protein
VFHCRKTPLYCTSSPIKPKNVQSLIKRGAKVNAPCCIGWRPLLMASNYFMRQRLDSGGGTTLDNGAVSNVMRLDGTLLYRASEEDHLGVAQLLFKYGTDINP